VFMIVWLAINYCILGKTFVWNGCCVTYGKCAFTTSKCVLVHYRFH
jgi:hypothetical protein